jgi:hypothetical protein
MTMTYSVSLISQEYSVILLELDICSHAATGMYLTVLINCVLTANLISNQTLAVVMSRIRVSLT